MSDQVKIGEIFNGPAREGPTGWVDITSSKSVQRPFKPKADSSPNLETTLWVGIASFRDRRCGQTLFNLFTKATYPKRITVGVVQQNEPGDLPCLKEYCRLMGVGHEENNFTSCPNVERIRVLEMDASEAQGPCWGRHLQSYLLADEEFCMQTDSHMDVLQGWDESIMNEWVATENEYGVLSTYVQDSRYMYEKVGEQWEVAHLCEVEFKQQPKNRAARAIRGMKKPKLTTTWGAGFSFSKCHAERAVPYDPYLNQIFDGEEYSKMLRLWTNGYDVYSPSRSYIFHDYSAVSKTKKWRDNKGPNGDGVQKQLALSNRRLWDLMEMPGSTKEGWDEVQAGPWGLGDRRTLDQFIEFTGVDLRKKSWIGITGNRCGSGVEWVPYDLPVDDTSLPKHEDGHIAKLDPNLRGNDARNDAKHGGDNIGGVSVDNKKASTNFTSWRTRHGKDPIVAGPRWSEIREKLEASGVTVSWNPSPEPEQDAAPARDAPHLGGDTFAVDPADGEKVSEGKGFAGVGMIFDEISVRDVDGECGNGKGANCEKNAGVLTAVSADGENVGKNPDLTGGEAHPLQEEVAQGPRSGRESTRGGSWALAGLLSCAVLAFVVRRRVRRQARKAYRSLKLDKRPVDWSGDAFLTGMSPMGVTSYMWQQGGKGGNGKYR